MLGVWAAHAMFAEPILQVSAKLRGGPAQAFSEAVATFGLIGTILGTQRSRPEFTPTAVGLYITAAYWFTASTSVANPAVTLARSLSDTFAGIAPASVPAFMLGQFAGVLGAAGFFAWLFKDPARHDRRLSDHDLPQPRLRHVAQRARFHRGRGLPARGDRLPPGGLDPPAARRPARRDGRFSARPAAGQGPRTRRGPRFSILRWEAQAPSGCALADGRPLRSPV